MFERPGGGQHRGGGTSQVPPGRRDGGVSAFGRRRRLSGSRYGSPRRLPCPCRRDRADGRKGGSLLRQGRGNGHHRRGLCERPDAGAAGAAQSAARHESRDRRTDGRGLPVGMPSAAHRPGRDGNLRRRGGHDAGGRNRCLAGTGGDRSALRCRQSFRRTAGRGPCLRAAERGRPGNGGDAGRKNGRPGRENARRDGYGCRPDARCRGGRGPCRGAGCLFRGKTGPGYRFRASVCGL